MNKKRARNIKWVFYLTDYSIGIYISFIIPVLHERLWLQTAHSGALHSVHQILRDGGDDCDLSLFNITCGWGCRCSLAFFSPSDLPPETYLSFSLINLYIVLFLYFFLSHFLFFSPSVFVFSQKISLWFQDPVDEENPRNKYLQYMDYCFTGVFACEMLLKVWYCLHAM